MNGMALSLGMLVAGAMVVFIGLPWRGRGKNGRTERISRDRLRSGDRVAGMTQQREAVLHALRDLDFDHALGKVTEEDYGPLRQALLVEAADLIAQLDREEVVAEPLAIDTLIDPLGLSVDEDDCPTCGKPTRPGAFFCATCGTRLALSCPQCDHPIRPGDRFCRQCGAEVALALP